MIKKILFGFALLATVASCTDDYTDWGQPQSNPQADAVAFGDGSVAPVGLIDFANIPETQELVQVCNITAPTASDEAYSNVIYKLHIGEASYDLTANGEMTVAELKKNIEDNFGKAPKEREMTAFVEQWISNGATAVKTATSADFTIKAVLTAPYISENYYIIGEPSAWSPTETSLKFTHSAADVYDDPIFTITIPVASAKLPDGSEDSSPNEMWFAITDDKTVASGDWNDVLGCAEGNGNNTESGKIARRPEIGNEGSFVIDVDGSAKFIKITLNMMDYSYNIEKLNFQEYLWVAGSGNNWTHGDMDMVSSPSFDGNYKGFMWLGNEFKFSTKSGWDGTNYGEGFSTDGGAGNMKLPAGYDEGYYMVEMNLASSTLNLTPITSLGVIGDATAKGWDGQTNLEYNAATRAWEGDVTFKDGEFKFRANDDWGINWGGDLTNLASGGANIGVAAGTYHVAFYPICEGKSHAVLTKK